jgi:hypothetical protein
MVWGKRLMIDACLNGVVRIGSSPTPGKLKNPLLEGFCRDCKYRARSWAVKFPNFGWKIMTARLVGKSRNFQ